MHILISNTATQKYQLLHALHIMSKICSDVNAEQKICDLVWEQNSTHPKLSFYVRQKSSGFGPGPVNVAFFGHLM